METNSNPPNPGRPGYIKRFFRWLFLIVGAVALFIVAYFLVIRFAFGESVAMPSRGEKICFALVTLLAAVFLAGLLMPFFRWGFRHMKWVSRLQTSLFTWRNARRLWAGLAILATLIAVFYAEENWRGKRAWEKCKRDLEAKGEMLDWSAYIPDPVPDDQNVFKAPKMSEWFVRPGWRIAYTNELTAKFGSWPLNDAAKRNDPKSPVLVAQVTVAPLDAHIGRDGEVIRFDTPDAKERLGKIVQDVVRPSANGPQNFTFVLRQPRQIKPIRLWLETERQLSFNDVSLLFPTNLVSRNVGDLRVEAEAAPGSFRVVLATKPVISAEDYLAVTDAATPEFELIREALKRPQIRMDGDFQRPFDMPIVNFVFMRTLAQTLASRAQCYLLLGKPEQAIRELSLIIESRRFLTAKPATLVAAMIDVAICGLYTQIIADGFRLQAWQEPELIALEKQLGEPHLSQQVVDALRTGRAAFCQTLLVISAKDFAEKYYYGESKNSLWKKITDPTYLLLKFAPRGWVYQNLVTVAMLEQGAYVETFNPETQLVEPSKAARANRTNEKVFAHWSPYNVLARNAVPNFIRAMQVAPRSQTLVNQALVVCWLERYRRAHGEYPETLDALVPQFIEKLPHDIIGGQPLHYRRTADGKFILYSVGWNEKDDGGQPGLTKNGGSDFEQGDWVWPMPAK